MRLRLAVLYSNVVQYKAGEMNGEGDEEGDGGERCAADSNEEESMWHRLWHRLLQRLYLG